MSLCRDMMPLWEMKAEMDRLTAEIERLRAALEKINVGEGWAALIARAALKGGQDE